MTWECTNLGTNIAEIVAKKSSMSMKELVNPDHLMATGIKNMKEAAILIQKGICEGQPITIFGDYDADGITSTVILTELLQKLGGNVTYRLPHRMTEGYGISMKAVESIEKGILITVDNGVTAVAEICEAKEKGLTVIVLDHHLPMESLPNADVIVDPHINPEENVFENYCGGALSLKLEEIFITEMGLNDPGMYWRHLALAAIATIADVMPLRGENRWIVQNGLKCLRHYRKLLPPALTHIMKECNLMEGMTETDIAFKLGPIFNAAGRMHDDGAKKVVEALLERDFQKANVAAQELIAINEARKEDVKKSLDLAHKVIADECLYGDIPLSLYIPDINEGIVGVITGKLAEEFQCPTFVFTNSPEYPNIWKGSARSYGDYDMKPLVDAISPVVIRAGGHAGAAGVTVQDKNFAEMNRIMQEICADYEAPETDVLYYDMEIEAKNIPALYEEVRRYAPYGEGNPAPVFKLKGIVLSPRSGSHYKLMGAENNHLKLLGNNFSAIGFDLASRFLDMGMPRIVDMIGTLSLNSFRYTKEYQVELKDVNPSDSNRRPKKIALSSAL